MNRDQPHSITATILLRSILRVAVALFAVIAVAALCLLYARFVEPRWLSVNTIVLSDSPTVTLIHISDIHYKGDHAYLSKVVDIINATEADFVCFTGDMVEEKKYLSECMAILSKLNKPLYGVPGNHDNWALVRKGDLDAQFEATGGKWLTNGEFIVYSNMVTLVGERASSVALVDKRTARSTKRILLSHYPSIVKYTPSGVYDLILAGHTHGGQVSLPYFGNPILGELDSAYAQGLFRTEAGPLYVSSGIGTYYWNVRFLCRPEITIIKL